MTADNTPSSYWVEALHCHADLTVAVRACAEALGPVPEGGFDLLFVFASSQYDDLDRLVSLLQHAIPHRHLIGCSGGGIIGAGREIEFSAAVGLVAARLPGVDLTPFHVDAQDLAQVGNHGRGPSGWHHLVGADPANTRGFILLAEPYSLPVEALTEGLDFGYASTPVVGGLASGGDGPGQHHLFLDQATLRTGAVGIALGGDIHMETVVAQGVRAIGPVYLVTGADDQYLTHLDGQPVFEVFSELFAQLSEGDRALAQRALLLGIAQRSFDDAPQPGDFLIRNIMGSNEEREALVVAAHLREGQYVQVHVRDAESSAEDLSTLLTRYRLKQGLKSTSGALMFSCMGRGRGLYSAPDFDSTRFKQIVGEIPLAGFFCNGEIGPVADTTYLHGYTSAFALFSKRNTHP